MSDTRPDVVEDTHDFQLRHHLAVIQAHAELLLAEAESLSAQQAAAVDQIMQSCYRLDTLAATDRHRLVPATIVPEPPTINHIHVVTESPYLSRVIEEQPGFHDGITLECTAPDTSVPPDTDVLLIDAVLTEGTGLDWIASTCAGEPAPFSLVSVYSDEATPVALCLSGLISPAVDETALTAALSAFVDDPEQTPIAGFMEAPPGTPLHARIEAHPDSVIDDVATAADAAIAGTDAPVVALSQAVFRRLTPRQLGALRTVGPGRGRPVLLVTDTDADPHGRDWIPTLGSRQFLHLPPDLVGLIAQLYAHQSTSTLASPG